MSKNLHEKKLKDLELIIWILVIGFLICLGGTIYFEYKYDEMKEMASLFCNMSNIQTDIIDQTFPYWEDARKKSVEQFNLTMPDITFPDKQDCERLIR